MDIDGTVPSPQLAADGDGDRDLVLQARAGSHDAREELARRIRRPAYLLALHIVGNPEDALDIAQDAMLRFFHTLDRFQPDKAIRPWLFTIVRNGARDFWRRRAARPSESLDLRPTLASELVDRAPDPEQQAIRLEHARQIWRAVEALSEHHREIIILRDFHDLSYAQVADVLQIPPGTVMSRLHAARMTLKELVHEGEQTRGPMRS